MQTTLTDILRQQEALWDVNEIGNRVMRDMRFVMGDTFGLIEMAMVDGFIYGQEDQGLMDFFEAHKDAVYSECRRRHAMHKNFVAECRREEAMHNGLLDNT